MFNFIDIYCERTGPGFLAEPINAFTNLAFFIAAFLALLLARKEKALDWRSGILIGLIVVIGTGSTFFHTFATFWAMLSDSLPILIYQITFIIFYAWRVMGWNKWRILALLGAFFFVQYLAALAPRDWINGSMEYAPAFLFLLGLAVWHAKNAARENWNLLAAAAIFSVSLVFRSIDDALCPQIPVGTHFLWHVLNGALLYLTARAYLLSARKPN
ncbi:MAG: ceramidase domain-containing protein [Alphaproteobacteria bacterium]|nr:ceramidase domain-containing protein [Alphaproteobacteria bacterium]MCD8570891.1 ceramidase domain-containing protein [Alphaproteobacteria bacterium]